MKTQQSIYMIYTLLLMISLSSLINSISITKNNNNSNKSNNNKNIPLEEKETIWKNLFSAPRGNSCSNATLKQQIKEKAKAKAQQIKFGNTPNKSDLWWVKNWGYDKSAYFFDYLSPVLKDELIKEFALIHSDMLKENSKSDGDYKDPYDYTNQITKDTSVVQKEAILSNLKRLNENYDAEIFKSSVNAVQIHKCLREWKWNINTSTNDWAKEFISNYDSNGDGRLNARELILGAIHYNSEIMGNNDYSSHLLTNSIKKIDAMFNFMDCDGDGLVSADDIWNNMSSLKRPSKQYDIFAFADKGVRTSSINDFVLKSMKNVNGKLNKEEFRKGILYGFWNRNTSTKKILFDDAQSLIHLRWKDDGMTDIVQDKLITEKEEKKAEKA